MADQTQAMQALDTAQARRMKRATFRHDLKAGKVTLRELLDVDDLDPSLERALLVDLVAVLPRFGQRKVAKMNFVAMRAGINLLALAGALPRHRRKLFVAIIEGVDASGDAPLVVAARAEG